MFRPLMMTAAAALCTGSGIRARRITATQPRRLSETKCSHAVTSRKGTVQPLFRCAWPEYEDHSIVRKATIVRSNLSHFGWKAARRGNVLAVMIRGLSFWSIGTATHSNRTECLHHGSAARVGWKHLPDKEE